MGLGPGDWFAKTLVDHLPDGDTIGLVPCAKNGEAIATFMEGGTHYTWMVNRAKAAQDAGGVISGILFHQGESDCTNPGWPANVAAMVASLKEDLGLGNVPFLAGELLRAEGGGSCGGHNTLVAQLPGLITNAHVISSEGCFEDTSDTTYDLHFDHDSQVLLGTRYGEKMIDVLGLNK
jgi:hypothetical protein